MASSTLQKLIRHRSESASKILVQLRQPLHPAPPPVLPRNALIEKTSEALSFGNRLGKGFLKSDHSFSGHTYPTFSFELFLNPISPTSLIRAKRDDGSIMDDSHVIRADSVKKKRKRKMNKHKLKKLRKRLSKKT